MLSREQILAADDLPREELEVPEWGGSVLVRTMTGSERDAYEMAQIKSPRTDVRARLASCTICDDEGKLLFSLDDIEALGRKSAAALDLVFVAAMRLNGIGKKDVDAMEKNSEPTPSDSSP